MRHVSWVHWSRCGETTRPKLTSPFQLFIGPRPRPEAVQLVYCCSLDLDSSSLHRLTSSVYSWTLRKKGGGGLVKIWSKFNSRPGKRSQGCLPLSQPLIHGLTLYIMHSYPTSRVCCLINIHLHLQRKHCCPWETGVEAPSPPFPVSELKLKRWGGSGGYPVSKLGLHTLRLSCYKVWFQAITACFPPLGSICLHHLKPL